MAVILSPIVLFAYKRLEHTKQTVSTLAQNHLAAESELICFCDGPRERADIPAVDAVRAYLKTVTDFKRVTVIEREKNYGLAASVISGVSDVLREHPNLIVLEDDMLTSPHFIRYMNDGLNKYERVKEVGTIQAYTLPVEDMPDFYFMLGADCWGWATWRDRWSLLQTDALDLLRKLYQRRELVRYDTNGAAGQLNILLGQLRGQVSSWHALWYATTFLHGKLALHPRESFIENIGADGSGTHVGGGDLIPTLLAGEYSGELPEQISENTAIANTFHDLWEKAYPVGLKGKIWNWSRQHFLVPFLCHFPGLARRRFPPRSLAIPDSDRTVIKVK